MALNGANCWLRFFTSCEDIVSGREVLAKRAKLVEGSCLSDFMVLLVCESSNQEGPYIYIYIYK